MELPNNTTAEQAHQSQLATQKTAAALEQANTHDEAPVDMSFLDSYGTRPSSSWIPSPFLIQHLGFDQSLFHSPILTDDRRAEILDQYAPLKTISYNTPLGMPQVSFNKCQQAEDNTLRNLQYLHSAVFRPFDIFASEFISDFQDHPKFAAYLSMLQDIRLLLFNTESTMTHHRKSIAPHSVNPHIHVPNPAHQPSSIMSDSEFQNALVQHCAATKARRDAKSRPRQLFSNRPDPQLF